MRAESEKKKTGDIKQDKQTAGRRGNNKIRKIRKCERKQEGRNKISVRHSA